MIPVVFRWLDTTVGVGAIKCDAERPQVTYFEDGFLIDSMPFGLPTPKLYEEAESDLIAFHS